jgi:hypothetical protein
MKKKCIQFSFKFKLQSIFDDKSQRMQQTSKQKLFKLMNELINLS